MSAEPGALKSAAGASVRRIRALTDVLSNQIAAGEVIERPASVLKELLENSLDAGAQRIEVEAESAGIGLLRVRDDGIGIHPQDMTLALSPHATSKIATLADLENVRSLGFRGEALASIASVSRMRLFSRTQQAESGFEIVAEGGVQQQVRPASGPQGTRVTVRDLFFNTPVRRKFLRSERTELRHLEAVIRRVGLSRFDVSLRFSHNGREGLRLTPVAEHQDPLSRVGRVCGAAFAGDSLYVEFDGPEIGLRGWLGTPAAARAGADLQYLFINGRAVRDVTVRHAVRQAFDNRIAPGRHPAYVLYLEMDPLRVDVNVHPAKQEVRFREARLVHDFVWRSLARALDSPRVSAAGGSRHPAAEFPEADAAQVAERAVAAFGGAVWTPAGGGGQPGEDPRPGLSGSARRIALLDHRYLAVAVDNELLLVDLKAARRVMILRALTQLEGSAQAPSRPLLLPLTVSAEARVADALEGQVDTLAALGFELRRAGPAAMRLAAVPADLAQIPAAVLMEAVFAWSIAAPTADALCARLADLGSDHLQDLLAAEDSLASFVRALAAHADALDRAQAWLRLEAGDLARLLHARRRHGAGAGE